jgi:hypothetical protein
MNRIRVSNNPNFIEQVRPGYWGRDAYWMRFSNYDLLQRKDRFFIIPSKGARLINYHPLQEPTMLQEFLELGKWYEDEHSASGNDAGKIPQQTYQRTYTNRDYIDMGDCDPFTPVKLSQQRIANRVIKLCNRYGLLGLMWKEIYEQYNPQVGLTRREFASFGSSYFPKGAPKEPLRQWKSRRCGNMRKRPRR